MTREEFLAAAAKRYDELQALNKLDNFYDYEKLFVKIWSDLGREVLEKNLGALPSDKRKKKRLTTTLGRITLSNQNPFSRGNHGFQISALLQELMVYAGTLDCYCKANEILCKFLSTQVSATQLFRLTDLYGEEVGKADDFTQRSQPPLQREETLYVEADGSMILTREQGGQGGQGGPGVQRL
jgi:hypothetical protein